MRQAYESNIITSAGNEFTDSYFNLQDFADSIDRYYYACIAEENLPFFLCAGASNNIKGSKFSSSSGYYNVPLVGIGTPEIQSSNLLHALDFINNPNQLQEFNGGQTGDYTTFRLVNKLKLSSLRTSTPNIQIRMFCHSSPDPATIPYTNLETDRLSFDFETWEQFMDWLNGNYSIPYEWNGEQFEFGSADFSSDHPYINTIRTIGGHTYEFIFFILNFKTDLEVNSEDGYISGIMPSVIIDNDVALDWDILNPNPTGTKILLHGNIYRPYSVPYEDPYYNINGETFGNLFANTYNPWPPTANMTFYASDYEVGQVDANNHFYINGRFILVYSGSAYNWGFFAWSSNDVRFYCALIPYLSNGIGKSYYPKVENNEITGEFFESSQLDDEGTIWQQEDDLSSATNSYTPDDQPTPPSQDGEDASVPNDNPNTSDFGNSVPLVDISSQYRFNYARQGTEVSLLTPNGTTELFSQLWASPQNFWQALSMNGSNSANVFDYIVSLRQYPFEINSGNSYQTVWLGGGGELTLKANSFYYLPSSMQHISLGGITWTPSFKYDFLNYKPYTTIYVHLPFSGTWEINPKFVMSPGSIFVDLYVDLKSGTGTYCITKLNLDTGIRTPIFTKTCQIGFDIPLTGANLAAQSSNIINATITNFRNGGSPQALVNSAVQAGKGVSNILSGNPLGVLDFVKGAETGITSFIAASSNLSSASREIPQMSGGSIGLSGLAGDNYCYFVVQRATYSCPKSFPHTKGYVCNATYDMSQLIGKGFHQCVNVDVSSINGATTEELFEIKSLLEGGIYT